MNHIDSVSLEHIREGNTDLAYRILKRAEAFCIVGRYSHSVKYRVSILNHLGCCMRRFGKFKVALSHLENAMKIVRSTNCGDLLATTCLNLCAVYRQLEDHKKALKYAKKATEEFSHQIINSKPEDFENRQAYDADYKDKVRMLAISYHNMSIEEEHFVNHEKSLEYAKKAYELMKGRFGENNHIAKKFKANYYNKLNSDPKSQQSIISLRGVSDKGAFRKPSISSKDNSQLLGQKLPEWKIRSNPYSKGPHKMDKFHGSCVPHPEFSQIRNPPQIPLQKFQRPGKFRPSSSQINRSGNQPSKSTNKKEVPGTVLRFDVCIKELKELGITSSGESSDSSGEEKKEIRKNRERFAEKIDNKRPNKAKLNERRRELQKEIGEETEKAKKPSVSDEEEEQVAKSRAAAAEKKREREKKALEDHTKKVKIFEEAYRKMRSEIVAQRLLVARVMSNRLVKISRNL